MVIAYAHVKRDFYLVSLLQKKKFLSMVGVFNITFSRQIIRNLNVSIDSSSTKKRDLTHERVLAYIKIPVYRK